MRVSLTILFAASLLGAAAVSGPVYANNDEDAQIDQCIDDNSDAGQSEDVLTTYCQCASGKANDFSVSISNWEKTHADDQEACSKEAGWKY